MVKEAKWLEPILLTIFPCYISPAHLISELGKSVIKELTLNIMYLIPHCNWDSL